MRPETPFRGGRKGGKEIGKKEDEMKRKREVRRSRLKFIDTWTCT